METSRNAKWGSMVDPENQNLPSGIEAYTNDRLLSVCRRIARGDPDALPAAMVLRQSELDLQGTKKIVTASAADASVPMNSAVLTAVPPPVDPKPESSRPSLKRQREELLLDDKAC